MWHGINGYITKSAGSQGSRGMAPGLSVGGLVTSVRAQPPMGA
jgi:hypothetical protein